MKKCLGLFWVLAFLPMTVSCNEMPKDPASKAGVQLVIDYVNDSCTNEINGDRSLIKYLHPDWVAVGNDNFDMMVVDENFKILKVELIRANRNFDHPKMETLLKVTVGFQEIGHFDREKGFVAERRLFPFSYYLSKHKGRYLILDSDDNDMEIYFYDAAVKSIQGDPTGWSNPQKWDAQKLLELLKRAHSS